jgi:hypothetical protein
MRLWLLEKNLLIERPSSLAYRQTCRTNGPVGRPGAACQAEGQEEAPTPGGAGARAAIAAIALATAGQDGRRRATSQVIQRSTANLFAVL